MPQNNQATTFTHVRGSGQVLLIEDYEHKTEYDLLVERLRAQNLEVIVRSSSPEDLFTDLGQLQPFDTVLLADVPREHFSDDQIQMLVRNTQNLGSGLVMLGGPNSFGAGGWTNTLLEEAMPVDFQIKNAKVVPIGALALLDARLGDRRRQPLAKGRRPRSDQNAGQSRLLRRAALDRDRFVALGTAGRHDESRCEPQPDAGPARQNDSRRHAAVRSGHGHGPRRLQETAGRGRQAHDHHQRRRSLGSHQRRDQ